MKIIASGIILLAVVIGIVPQWTDCGPDASMKCHWTARASIAHAVPLALIGGIAALGRNRPARRALAVLGIALGTMVILLPTWLIGVCMDALMRCNMIMKPTLIFAGLITVALSAAMYIMSRGDSQ
jgi:hypothetical protein